MSHIYNPCFSNLSHANNLLKAFWLNFIFIEFWTPGTYSVTHEPLLLHFMKSQASFLPTHNPWPSYMTKLQVGQEFLCWSNVSQPRFDQCFSQLTNFRQWVILTLTKIWLTYDQGMTMHDVSQIFSKMYIIKWPWYGQAMTKIWPRIVPSYLFYTKMFQSTFKKNIIIECVGRAPARQSFFGYDSEKVLKGYSILDPEGGGMEKN